MSTVQDWDMCNKEEKRGTVEDRIVKPMKLSGHRYKERFKSLAKKAKTPDYSTQGENNLSQSEVNVAEPIRSNENGTTNGDSSFSQSHRERVDFMLRRVEYSGHVEKTNSSGRTSPTKERKKSKSESKCNLNASRLEENISNYECKTSTTFVEYWVPVRLSNFQTEQYCGSLFSNAGLLCSTGLDSRKFIHDILVSARKCCDHPYLVDRSLRTTLIEGIPGPERLDAEIRLSNKLLLFHKILLEFRKRGLRVFILYQSLGSSEVYIGDILDDIVHDKFGTNSFVRISGGMSRAKRTAVLESFNEEGSEKFVCLMEIRQCRPTIELKSIDTVIFFNSDWNPMNDLRALKKINLDSQCEQVKVFRLYSPCTVEEKVLILSKQDMAPEGNIVNLRQSTCHDLLTWGAPYLFKKLDEFHNSSTSDIHSDISSGDSFVEDLFLELSALLPNSEKSNGHTSNSFILEVQPVGGVYPRNITLFGEVEYPLMDNFLLFEEIIVNEPPSVFWTNLLGRKPNWKYFSSQSSKTRKIVQSFGDLMEGLVGDKTATKKCRTEGGSYLCQIPTDFRRRKRSKLQRRGKKRKLPVRRKVKHASELSDRRREVNSRTNQQDEAAAVALVLSIHGLPTSNCDPISSPTSRQSDHIRCTNDHSVQTQVCTQPLVEELDRPLESSTGEVPLQTDIMTSHVMEDRREQSNINQGNVSLSSLNCQHPEAPQASQSKTPQYVCKALQIEMERLQKQKNDILKRHDDMKLEMEMAFQNEIDLIRKKYDAMIQNAEMAFVEEKEVIENRCNKVYINKSLAEAIMLLDDLKDTTCCVMEELRQLIRSSPFIMPPVQQGTIRSFPLMPSNTQAVSVPSLASQQRITGSSMNTTALPPVHISQVNLSANLHSPTTPNLSSQSYCGIARAPAPHLRNTWQHLPPITTPKFFSPVRARGMSFSAVVGSPFIQ